MHFYLFFASQVYSKQQLWADYACMACFNKQPITEIYANIVTRYTNT